MARYLKVNKTSNSKIVKKGAWNAEEDRKLVAYIMRYGIWNWTHMAEPAGLARTGKSCRLRWMNYLRPNIKHGNITEEEEKIIINLHRVLGNRWATIASKLPGRTDNEIKNYWNTRLKKRFNPNPSIAVLDPTEPANLGPPQEIPKLNVSSLCPSYEVHHSDKTLANLWHSQSNMTGEEADLWEQLLSLNEFGTTEGFEDMCLNSGNTSPSSECTCSDHLSFGGSYDDFTMDLWGN